MQATIAQAKADGDYSRLAESIPYFGFLGLRLRHDAAGLICVLAGAPHLIGNPGLPALHGGVVGGLLEAAAIVQLIWSSEGAKVPKIIGISVDYLRSARPVETFAQATVTKHGRRVANVRVEAWQDDRARPVAAAHAHFLLS